jgi:3-hydroxyacyl-[acyl-carrier-protein] dehydratase
MRFTLLDRIVSLEAGRTIRAIKTMPPGEELFLDHFPGFPVVPGVLLVEMMAQAAGRCLHAETTDRGLAMLGKINSAVFRGWVKPGEVIDIFSEISTSRPQFATASCRIEVGGQPRAQAELLFGYVPRTSFAPEYRDLVLEDYQRRQAAGSPT